MVRLIIWATILSCSIALFRHLRKHGARSFHAGWILILLLAPCWFRVAPGNFMQLDVRSAAAFVILLALVLEPNPGGFRFRFVVSDLLVVLCYLEQVVSHFNAGEVTPTIPYNELREWLLPYVIGRLFIRGWWDIDRALPGICIAATVLAVLTMFEGVSRIHIWYKLLGNYETVWFQDDSIRWGLRRPVVSHTHSIYLGLTMAMMVPWVLEAFRRALAKRGPEWWIAVLPILLAGIFCSTSRGAQIAALCVLAADYFFRRPSLRPALLAVTIAAAIGAIAMREEIIDMLSAYAGESKEEGFPIVIDGVTYPYSGTHHRELLTIAYKEASENAGLLGYGNPGNVPQPPDLDGRLRSVDDHYLMWNLLYGDLGLLGFVCLMIVVGYYALMAAWPADGPFAGLAGGLVGAMIGLAFAMRSVWFATDYGQVWLWTAGVAASIHELRLRALYGRHG